jgi:coiled-coil domain-containing protein 130
LRERARKLDRGILIIRFEMPYNIWCDGCKSHVAMGVRYNAEKTKIGMYYTTPIYQFRMKCHLCDNHFEIKTDPQVNDLVKEKKIFDSEALIKFISHRIRNMLL